MTTTPITYRDAVDFWGLSVFEDLNRPSDRQMEALASHFGFTITADGFEFGLANMDDPATQAMSQMLRAAQTARSVKRQSPDYGIAG